MPRDPDDTRRRILEAAADAFAGQGFAGARVDAIAAAAGTNKRMLYHYFGDKGGLHRAVLDRWLPADGDGVRGSGAPLPPRAARLLLWSLLEPATAASARARWGSRLSGNGGAVVLSSLIASLMGDGGRGLKPRVRLTQPGRGGPSPER